MKRVIAIIVSLLMVISMAACSKTNEQPEPEPEKEVISEVSGIVDAIDDSTLELYTDSGQDVDFDISHAEFTTEHDLRAGDIASVEYKGDIADGNTTEFEAVKVSGTKAMETVIEGKVESINTDSTITISSNGKQYKFKVDDVSVVKKGDNVKIDYAGMIEGEDTSHAFVRKMEVSKETEKKNEKTKDSVTIKAVTDTVYTTAAVNIRADANTSSDIITTVDKGTKLSRTGILSNGWSRVKYKDKDRYVATGYLTTKAPKEDKEKEDKNAAESKEKTNTAVEKDTEKQDTKVSAADTKKKNKDKQAAEAEEEPAPEDENVEEPATEDETVEEPAPEEETVEEPAPEEEVTEEPAPEEETVEEPAPEEEVTEEPAPEEEAQEEPATVTVKGVVKEFVKDKKIVLEDGKEFNLTKDTKIDGDLDEETAVGQNVSIEYTEDTKDAVHIYPVDGSKGVGDSAGSGPVLPIVLVAIVAAAIAAIAVMKRNKGKSA